MRAALVIAVVASLAACKSHKGAPAAAIDPAPINAALRALADRACGCNNDPACVKYVRADWDAGKKGWLEARKSFPQGGAVVFDSEQSRMSLCGDAAGVTFWKEL